VSDDSAAIPPHWQPGSTIAGRFQVERVVGIGGMGAVLEAQNVSLGQRVALKVLRRELIHDKDAQARFDQEARIVAQLNTEHVVRVHDLGRTEHGEPFIVMELLAGKTFDHLIEEPTALGVAEAVDLVAEAAVGIAVAHAHGLVHRDVKPGNLFVAAQSDGRSIVKVLDFGLTKVTRSDVLRLTSSASIFGTPLYMSPEQIMSAKKVDHRADQHALAMVLFELLTKSPPYMDESVSAITVKIATEPPPSARSFRADVPPALDAVIQKALAKTPDGRFEDIAAFALSIAAFGTDRGRDAARRAATALNRPPAIPDPATLVPTQHARTPQTVRGWSSARRARPARRQPWAIAVGITAALGVGAAVVAWRLSQPADSATHARRSGEVAIPSGGAGVVPASASGSLDAAPADTVTQATPAESAAPTAASSEVAVVPATASASAAPSPPHRAGRPGPRPPATGAPTSPAAAPPTAAPTGEFIPKYGK
jgi:serine/threonine-protein kinase